LRNSKHTFFVEKLFSENCSVYEIIWENMLEPNRPQMTVLYGAEKMCCACQLTKARIQTHIENV